MLLGISIPISILLLITGIVILVIYNIKHKDEKMSFNIRLLLKIYLYFISYVTLVALTFGASLGLKAAMSYIFEYEFSYQLSDYYEPCKGTETINEKTSPCVEEKREIYMYKDKKYYVNYNQRKQDIINGITLFSTMLVLFLVHIISLRFVEEKKDSPSGFKKAYIYGSLILYSILSIVSIPIGIYQLINYYVIDLEKVEEYSRAVPGEALASMIAVVPLWIIFLILTIRMYRKEKV